VSNPAASRRPQVADADLACRLLGTPRGEPTPQPRLQHYLLTAVLQASAAFPENTLASFEAAIRDGAEGIESGI